MALPTPSLVTPSSAICDGVRWITASARIAVAATVAALTLLTPSPPANAAQWKAKVEIRTYPVTGTTGQSIYESIGRNGPKIGKTRAIAHTTFDLKWRRKYVPVGRSCKLVSAKPFFTIIYTVPKVTGKLPPDTARKWKTFHAGILAHEKVHGQYARDMLASLIGNTVGLTVQNDPNCQKIRAEVLTRVKAAYATYRNRSRAFDRVETAGNGGIRRLVRGFLG